MSKKTFTEKQLADLEVWDDELVKQTEEKWREHHQQAEDAYNERMAETERERAKWRAKYDAYLQTARWREKRRMVLKRDNYVCQGCLEAHATQVHHTTYKHTFDELLFELTSLCDDCHKRAHGK